MSEVTSEVEYEFSASQLEADDRCRRYFWFRHVAHLPEIQSQAQVFGTVLHSVCERWLLADEVGRDRGTKAPVDIYPKGWDDGITPVEADLIRKLVDAAILGDGEISILSRHRDNAVEAEFRGVPFVEGATIRGFIDLRTPEGIVDHKTMKNVTRYALSPAALKNSIQMQIYAKIFLMDLSMDGRPIPDQVLLQHNNFSKDPEDPRVRPVKTWVTPSEIDAFWKKMQVKASELLQLKRAAPIRNVADVDLHWRHVPGAANAGDVLTIRGSSWDHPCRKYGGCPYSEICCGVQKPSEYAADVVRRNENNAAGITPQPELAAASIQPQPTGETNVSKNIFEARMAAAAAVNGGAPPAASGTVALPPPPEASPASQPIQTPVTSQAVAAPAVTRTLPAGAPPWGRAECGACEGKGFSTSGNVCRPCRSHANGNGKVSPDWFEVGYENGLAFWEVKKEHALDVEKEAGSRAAGGEICMAAPTAAVVEARTQAPAASVFGARGQALQAAPAAPAATAAHLPSPTQPAAPPATPATVGQNASETPSETAARVRKPKGFTLFVNCGPSGPASNVLRLDSVFAKYGAQLAANLGKASYWELETYPRRDMLASKIEGIIEEEGFGTKFVIATDGSKGSDIRAFVDAVKGHAGQVIEAYTS